MKINEFICFKHVIPLRVKQQWTRLNLPVQSLLFLDTFVAFSKKKWRETVILLQLYVMNINSSRNCVLFSHLKVKLISDIVLFMHGSNVLLVPLCSFM